MKILQFFAASLRRVLPRCTTVLPWLGLAIFVSPVQAQSAPLNVLCQFTGESYNDLVQGRDGNFYGLNESAFYQLTPSGQMTTLHAFAPSESFNPANLIQSSDGFFYATDFGVVSEDLSGSSDQPGGVFKLTLAGETSDVHDFSFREGENSSGLIQGSDGNFYGVTSDGGKFNTPYMFTTGGYGTVFKLALDGTLTVLHKFQQTDGEYPETSLVEGRDGNFYGTTSTGGTGGGTLFKITPTGELNTLHNFNSKDGGPDGPNTPLIQGRDGNFYGTTGDGGANGKGTVFTTTSEGTVTILHNFGALNNNAETGTNSDGASPSALVQGGDGRIYGATSFGGSHGDGTLFTITPGGALTVLHSFDDEEGRINGLFVGNGGAIFGNTSKIVFTVEGSPMVSPTVTLSAPVAEVAVGSGQPGEFLLTSSTALTNDMIVQYMVSGSAVAGTDYRPLSGTAKIKAGTTSAMVKIVPEGDLGGASARAVKLKLASSNAYTVGTPAAVKVKISAGN